MNKSKVRKLKWILDKIRGCNFHFSLFLFFLFCIFFFFAFKDVSLLFSTSLHFTIFFCLSSFYCCTTSSNPVQLSLSLSLSLSYKVAQRIGAREDQRSMCKAVLFALPLSMTCSLDGLDWLLFIYLLISLV